MASYAKLQPEPEPEPYEFPFKRGRSCLHRMLIAVALSFIAVAMTNIAMDVSLRRYFPAVSLTSASALLNFTVEEDAIFNTLLNKSYLSSSFDMAFSIQNPNEKAISYHHVSILVRYRLDREYYVVNHWAPLLGLDESGGHRTDVVVKTKGWKNYIDPSVYERMESDIEENGVVEFEARLDATVRFARMSVIDRWMTVGCPVRIRFEDSNAAQGVMAGPPTSCEVRTGRTPA